MRLDRHDGRQLAAALAFLKQPQLRFVTTSVVAGEAFTLLRRRAGYRVAIRVLDELHSGSQALVLPMTEDVDALARQMLQRFGGVPLSYADATLLAVSQTLDISTVFSFDSDFRLAGLTLVP